MLKRETKMAVLRRKRKLQIGKYVAAVVILCGLAGTGKFSLGAEAAEMEVTQTEAAPDAAGMQENGNQNESAASEQGTVLEAEKRIEMKVSPQETAETLMTFQKGDLIFVVGEPENGWYRVLYQGNEGYVEEDGLVALEIDIEGLDAEMAVNGEETKFVVEVVEKYRTDARRSKIWGAVIIVLVVGIFGVGIFSAIRSNKSEDPEKNVEKKRRKKELEKIEIEDLD